MDSSAPQPTIVDPTSSKNGAAEPLRASAGFSPLLDPTGPGGLLLSEILAHNRLHSGFLQEAVSLLGPDELTEFDRYVAYCVAAGQSVAFLAQCYNLIVRDTLREQLFFQKHKRYRFSTYEEAAASVYLNPEYMTQYMYGLAITSFLWPNHSAIKKFFLGSIPTDRSGRYFEIGPGHGFYFLQAMRHTAYSSFEGVDISPTSVAMTRDILAHSLTADSPPHSVRECNFLDFEFTEGFDAVVMGEVLEHVESPETFLRRIAAIAKPNAYIFVTTCINSPAVDHISLFASVEHLESIIRASGLISVENLVLPYHHATLEESVDRCLPINVAYVLAPQ